MFEFLFTKFLNLFLFFSTNLLLFNIYIQGVEFQCLLLIFAYLLRYEFHKNITKFAIFLIQAQFQYFKSVLIIVMENLLNLR